MKMLQKEHMNLFEKIKSKNHFFKKNISDIFDALSKKRITKAKSINLYNANRECTM